MSLAAPPSDLSDPTLERSFRGHKGAVTSVSFSPTLRQLASGSHDHLVMIWNFKPQLRAFRFIGHKGVVTSVEFSPTGHLLASASTDNTVRLWEPTVRGKCSILKAHSAPVRSVSWSSDSKLLITASDDKTCKIWGSSGARFWCSLVGHTNWVRSAVLSRDTRLAASGSDDKTVKLWDIHTHQCVQTYYDHQLPVRTVKFHPHGSVVASAGVDNSIKLYDLRSHQMIQHYSAHDNVVNAIDFHPSGDFLLSGSDDSSIKIFDLREGHQLYTIHGHKGATLDVKWSTEGDFFATAGADQRVMTWASNFDKVAESNAASTKGGVGSVDPTMYSRRKKVHIAPSEAEQQRSEMDDGNAAVGGEEQYQQYEAKTIIDQPLPAGYSVAAAPYPAYGQNIYGQASQYQQLQQQHQQQQQHQPQQSYPITQQQSYAQTQHQSQAHSQYASHHQSHAHSHASSPRASAAASSAAAAASGGVSHLQSASSTPYPAATPARSVYSQQHSRPSLSPPFVSQPAPHPEIALQHDCAYDHAHAGQHGRPHAYTDAPGTINMASRALGNAASYQLPPNHQTAFPAPPAPVQQVVKDNNVRSNGSEILQGVAGADVTSVRLPDQLTHTLQHIVTQLDLISRTVKDMEERLTLHEAKLEDLEMNTMRRERNEQHQMQLREQQQQRERETEQKYQHQARSPIAATTAM